MEAEKRIRLSFIEAEKRIDDIVNDRCSLMLKETNDALNTILTNFVSNSENMAILLKTRLKNLEMSVICNITSNLPTEQKSSIKCFTMEKEEVNQSEHVKLVKEKKEITCIKTNIICSECNKGFVSQHNLRKHQKSIHLKLKDLKCKECNYATSDGSDLIKHIQRRHPNIKKYACDLCGHSELREKDMKGHYENVHNVKKLRTELRTTGYEIFEGGKLSGGTEQCIHCGLLFSNSNLLEEHIMSLHQRCYSPVFIET